MTGDRPAPAHLDEVADGVWAYVQPDGGWGWSNAGLVEGDADGSLLVDTLFDLRLTREMLETMTARIPAAHSIRTVVNTHSNGDHCYGNQLVAGAEIVASVACAAEMAEVTPQLLAGMLASAASMGATGTYISRIFGSFEFHGIEVVLPTSTFTGEHELKVADMLVRLIELGPAHTRGDIVAWLPDQRVVFTGDLLFHGGHPIVWAGPVSGWVDALDRIVALEPRVVVPGHGPVTDVTTVLEMREYFGWLVDEARARYDSGLASFDAAKELAAAARYARWGEGERLAVNVAELYAEWSGQPAPPVMELFGQMAALSL